MDKFMEGLGFSMWNPPKKPLELSTDQIFRAKKGKDMADIIDDIEKVLAEHAETISTIEGFMEQHAKKAAAAVDPIRLQGVLEGIKSHTSRLAQILEKFPITQ